MSIFATFVSVHATLEPVRHTIQWIFSAIVNDDIIETRVTVQPKHTGSVSSSRIKSFFHAITIYIYSRSSTISHWESKCHIQCRMVVTCSSYRKFQRTKPCHEIVCTHRIEKTGSDYSLRGSLFCPYLLINRM